MRLNSRLILDNSSKVGGFIGMFKIYNLTFKILNRKQQKLKKEALNLKENELKEKRIGDTFA